ncbi:MAG: glycosyltransferase [Deltaproteobacteria bacterium]|nr:glycosyltransferase [Deltaproteobacteria bacterium]
MDQHNKRQKIGIVIGTTSWPQLIHSFLPLTKQYDFSIYLAQKENILSQIPHPMKAYLFQEKASIPGFLQDAESQMAEEDLLICINIGSLSSLQACKVSESHNIPLLCYTGDYDLPRYQNYPNLQNAMQLMIRQASGFIVPVTDMARNLIQEGVAEEKIISLTPAIIRERFHISTEKRLKFRNYVGMGESEIILLYHGPLEPEFSPEAMIHAMNLQKKINRESFPHMRMIFAGNGDHTRELQLLAYKLGLGKSTYFLSQDTTPFIDDLFCAADILVSTCPVTGDYLPVFPYHIMEAMACGTIVLIPEGAASEPLVPKRQLLWHQSNSQSLAFAISQITKNSKTLYSWKKNISRHIFNISGKKDEIMALKSFIEQLIHPRVISASDASVSEASELSIPWAFLKEHAASSQHADEVIRTIDSINNSALKPGEHSLLSLYRAHALRSLFHYDEAFWEYERSLQWNSRQVDAYSGMGMISWHNHNHEEALTQFRKGLALNPQDHSCMLGIGLVYKRLGMTEEALCWLEKCATAEKGNSPALKALIQTCNECRDYQQGISALERVMETTGEEEILMNGLGHLYMKAGRTEAADQIFSRFLNRSKPLLENQ